jgi:hypothetical protein
MDAIFQSTVFYRIRNGLIVEKTPGNLVEPGQERLYVNALRSYLLDLFLYDTVKIRHLDGITPYGSPQLTREGFDFVKEVSSNLELSKSIVNVNKTFRLKEGLQLKTLLRPRTTSGVAEFNETDVQFASVLSSMAPLMNMSDVVVNRPFERVYNFLYDESIVRSSITGDDITRPAKRKQFDIFTLALRVAYGGGQ